MWIGQRQVREGPISAKEKQYLENEKLILKDSSENKEIQNS